MPPAHELGRASGSSTPISAAKRHQRRAAAPGWVRSRALLEAARDACTLGPSWSRWRPPRGHARMITGRRPRVCDTAARARRCAEGRGGRPRRVGAVRARPATCPRPARSSTRRTPFEEPAGGGAVAAVQLARLAGSRVAVHRARRRRARASARSRGCRARRERAAPSRRRAIPTRRALTLVDDRGERTITTLGPRLEPLGARLRSAGGELAGARRRLLHRRRPGGAARRARRRARARRQPARRRRASDTACRSTRSC